MPAKTTCSVNGCNGEILSKGLCRRHYMERWRRSKGIMPALRSGEESAPASESLLRKLVEARQCYLSATGIAARTYWRRKVEEYEVALMDVNPESAQ